MNILQLMSTNTVPGTGDLPDIGGDYSLDPLNIFKWLWEMGIQFLSFRITLTQQFSFTLLEFLIGCTALSIMIYLVRGFFVRDD